MNKSMLSVAQKESIKRNLARRLKFIEANALNFQLPEETFDLVTSTLMISELQPTELTEFIGNAAKFVKPGGMVAIGGETELTGGFMGRIVSAIRRISYWIVSRLTELGPHPYHQLATAMKAAGLVPLYKVRFLEGLLTLYVAKAR